MMSKSGVATVRNICVVAVIPELDFPITSTKYVSLVVPAGALMLKAAVAGVPGPTTKLETVVGLTNGDVSPVLIDVTLAVKLTVSLKPYSESTAILKLPLPGSTTVRKSGVGVRLKAGEGTTRSIRAVLVTVVLATSTRKEYDPGAIILEFETLSVDDPGPALRSMVVTESDGRMPDGTLDVLSLTI